MFIIDDAALARTAALRYLQGQATDSLADRVAATKIVDLSAARARLRAQELEHRARDQ